MFHAVGTDHGDANVDFTIPMIFESLSDDGSTAVADEYNASSDAAKLANREAQVPGQTVMFAAATDPSKRNTELVTDSLNFVLDRGTAHPSSSRQTCVSRRSKSCSATTSRRRSAWQRTSWQTAWAERPASSQRLRRRTSPSSRQPIPLRGSSRRRLAWTSTPTRPGASQRRTWACPRCRASSARSARHSRTHVRARSSPSTFFGFGRRLAVRQPAAGEAPETQAASTAAVRTMTTTTSGTKIVTTIEWESVGAGVCGWSRQVHARSRPRRERVRRNGKITTPVESGRRRRASSSSRERSRTSESTFLTRSS